MPRKFFQKYLPSHEAIRNNPYIAPFSHPPGFDWSNLAAWLRALFEWALSLGKPLAVGLVALAVGLAIAGYVVVQLAWRAHVVLAWRRRQRRRAERDSG